MNEREAAVESCLTDTHVLTHVTRHIANIAGHTYNWTPESVVRRMEGLGLDVKIRAKLKQMMMEIVQELK